MGTVIVVVGDVLADKPEQMSLSKHDEVIEQLAAQRADPSFGESVLPGRARRNPELLNAKLIDTRVEFGAGSHPDLGSVASARSPRR